MMPTSPRNQRQNSSQPQQQALPSSSSQNNLLQKGQPDQKQKSSFPMARKFEEDEYHDKGAHLLIHDQSGIHASQKATIASK